MSTLKYVAGPDLMTVTLGGAYTPADGVMTLTGGDGAKLPATGDFWIRPTSGTLRVFKVTANAADVLTVVIVAAYGADDTDYAGGTEFKWALTAEALDQLKADLNFPTSTPIGFPASLPESGEAQLFIAMAMIDQVPTMTAANAPSGVASASTEYSGSEAWKAFTTFEHGWITDGSALPQYIQYQFPTAKVIYAYRIRGWDYDNFPARCPYSWTLQGSNNGSDWTVIDTRTSLNYWSVGMYIRFVVATPGSYSYYRLNITANFGNTYTGVNQFELLNDTDSTSLTGFVRDSNGRVVEQTANSY